MKSHKNKITQPIKNKRGVAIESAITMMVVVFSLCALITVFCVATRTTDKNRFKKLAQEAAVDSIGEKFVKCDNKADFKGSTDDYICDVTHDDSANYTLVIKDKNDRHLLTVKCNNSGEIICWSRISVKDN